jgi:hypothetical protein
VHDEFECVGVVALRDLGIRHWMIVSRFECEEPGKPIEPSAHQVEVQVVGEGAPAVSSSRCIEELGDFGDIPVGHLTLDFQASHATHGTPNPSLLLG